MSHTNPATASTWFATAGRSPNSGCAASLRNHNAAANSATPTPRSSGLSKGTCGSGAAEPFDATLANSVHNNSPAASTAPAVVRYAVGAAETGQRNAVVARCSSITSSAGTTSQPSQAQALFASPQPAVTARPCKAPSAAITSTPSVCIAAAAGAGHTLATWRSTSPCVSSATGQAHQPPSWLGECCKTALAATANASSGAWPSTGQAIWRHVKRRANAV